MGPDDAPSSLDVAVLPTTAPATRISTRGSDCSEHSDRSNELLRAKPSSRPALNAVPAKRPILLLGAAFNTRNMGVNALAAGALSLVASAKHQADLRLLDYGISGEASTSRADASSPIPLINLRFSWKIFLPNNVALLLLVALAARRLSPRVRARILRANRWLASIDDAGTALAVSGGDSFSDIYGVSRLLYVAMPQLLVLLLGRKLVLLPQSIGPFKGRFSRAVATTILRRTDAVYCRDWHSVAEAKKLLGANGDTRRVRFCHDMALLVEPRFTGSAEVNALRERARAKRLLIGLNISGLLLMGGYSRRNMFRLKSDYSELVDRLIAFLIDERGADVVLIPHVFGEGDESDASAVLSFHGRLKQRYGDSLHCLQGVYDHGEIKYLIGLTRFFIGSRMHACIAALSQFVPTIAIAYSPKFAGVLDSIGVGDLVADPRRQSIPEILQLVDAALANTAHIERRLRSAIPIARRRLRDVANEIDARCSLPSAGV